MYERIEISSPKELEDFINSATKEELYVLREDILNGTAFEDNEE